MNPQEIHFFCEEGYEIDPDIETEIRNKSLFVLQQEKSILPVNIILTGDSEIRELNREYRHKDKTTDVLSFPWEQDTDSNLPPEIQEEERLLGELYISVPQVQRQAPRFDTSFAQELERVVVHGLLHLLGYDHLKVSERKIMRAKEESYLGRSPYQEVQTPL